jgi:pimeloyl-ACP methyl ester carboxylesterase
MVLRIAEEPADAFPHARLVEIEGGRTFIPLDEPDRLASEISAFLVPA